MPPMILLAVNRASVYPAKTFAIDHCHSHRLVYLCFWGHWYRPCYFIDTKIFVIHVKSRRFIFTWMDADNDKHDDALGICWLTPQQACFRKMEHNHGYQTKQAVTKFLYSSNSVNVLLSMKCSWYGMAGFSVNRVYLPPTMQCSL